MRVASIYSCSVTADVIGKEARKIVAFYRAMLAQSAVIRLHVVCPSVCNV